METNTLTYENLKLAISKFTDDFIETYKSILISDGKVASGNLVKSIHRKTTTKEDDQIYGEISIADYWKYVEYGRKPGKFPPPDAMLAWVKAKNILPRPQNGLRQPTQEQIAFLIGRKIAQYGIEPGGQYAEAMEITWRKHEPLISRAIQLDIEAAV